MLHMDYADISHVNISPFAKLIQSFKFLNEYSQRSIKATCEMYSSDVGKVPSLCDTTV